MPEAKPIKVLFIARKFPPSVGGMERFAVDLYNALSKKAEVKLIKWGGSNKYLPLVLPIFFIRASWLLLITKIDIIHIQDGLQAPMGLMLKLIWHRPVCVVIHGLDVTFENNLYQTLIPSSLKRANHIICISGAAQAEALKRGIVKQKTSVIPLGVTDDIYANNKAAARQRVLHQLKIECPDAKIILSTGRLVKRKGIDWFINNVMPQLVKYNKHIIFLVSGDGSERDTIDRSIKHLNLSEQVRLLGRTDDELLKDLYNGSDLFVMPNITVPGDMEGFGRVLIEASLCKLPVVASGIEGIKDAIVDNQNGFLVGEKDTKAFIDHINDLLNNSKKAEAFGKKSRDFSLKRFNWDNIASQYLKIYNRLLNNQ